MSVIHLDQSTPFNPVVFVGNGWVIKEQDKHSLELAELDLLGVRLVTMLRVNEPSIACEERLRRIKEARYIRLDARVLQMLLKNQHLIPEDWKKSVVFFDGTILQDRSGDRATLFLFCDGDEEWHWGLSRICDIWAGGLSAVLAST